MANQPLSRIAYKGEVMPARSRNEFGTMGMICPSCGGYMENIYGELCCINCGIRKPLPLEYICRAKIRCRDFTERREKVSCFYCKGPLVKEQ